MYLKKMKKPFSLFHKVSIYIDFIYFASLFMNHRFIMIFSVQSDNLHAVTINCTVGIPFSLKHSIDSE